ncbi:MAG: hypothetical protein H6637_05575 [Ardenticatenales bacterium]|nr:hypothetical protein [Ardenticatenales bacterium]
MKGADVETHNSRDARHLLREAFRGWYHAERLGTPLSGLFLFELMKGGNEQSVRSRSNGFLMMLVDQLRESDPESAELLLAHYVDRESTPSMMQRFGLSADELRRKQSQALGRVSEIYGALEQSHLVKFQNRLDHLLPQYVDEEPIGIEKSVQKVENLLISEMGNNVVALWGMGGIGKTTLAVSAIRRAMASGYFSEVAWVSAKQSVLELDGRIRSLDRPALSSRDCLMALVDQLLDFDFIGGISSQDAEIALREKLQERRHLIVIDNLETLYDVQGLMPILRISHPGRILITSRERYDAVNFIHHYSVAELDEAASIRLLRRTASQDEVEQVIQADDATLRIAYQKIGGNPLALRLFVGQALHSDLQKLVHDLERGESNITQTLYRFIFERAWQSLGEETQQVFMSMVFTSAAGDRASDVMATTGLPREMVMVGLDNLVRQNLVDVKRRSGVAVYTIHSLTRAFLEAKALGR